MIVGFLINLASAYFKPFLDRIVSRVSNTRKVALQKKREYFERRVCKLLSNPIVSIELMLSILNHTLLTVCCLTMGLLAGVGATTVRYSSEQFAEKDILMFGLILIMGFFEAMGIHQSRATMDLYALLSEVRKRRIEPSGLEQVAR